MEPETGIIAFVIIILVFIIWIPVRNTKSTFRPSRCTPNLSFLSGRAVLELAFDQYTGRKFKFFLIFDKKGCIVRLQLFASCPSVCTAYGSSIKIVNLAKCFLRSKDNTTT